MPSFFPILIFRLKIIIIFVGELLLEDNKPQDALKYFKIVIENDLPRAFLETSTFISN